MSGGVLAVCRPACGSSRATQLRRPSDVRSAVRGFTLIEAAVTMVIAGIVALAAISLHVSVGRNFTGARKVADLSDRLLSATTYIARELTTIGGNGATASMSLFIENNCLARGAYPGCPRGSDRITFFAAVPRTPACRVSHVDDTVTPPRLAFWFRDVGGAPHCCFNDEFNGSRTAGVASQYMRRHAMLSIGTFHKPVLLIAEASAPGFTSTPAPASYADYDRDADGEIDTRCTFRAIEVMPAALNAEPPTMAGWIDANAAVVDMRALYIDDREVGAPPKLILHTDKDENAAGVFPTTTNGGTPAGAWGWSDIIAAEDETLLVLDGAYDFQTMLGYDLDGDEVVSAGEWTHDVAGEARNMANDRRLRLIRFDITLGVVATSSLIAGGAVPSPARDGGTTLSIPGVALRVGSVTVLPRNGDMLLGGE